MKSILALLGMTAVVLTCTAPARADDVAAVKAKLGPAAAGATSFVV